MRKTLFSVLVLSALAWLACKDLGDQPKVSNAVLMSPSDVTVVEGQTARLVISLSKPADSAVTFDYATGGGTATVGSDYAAVSGSDTVAVGKTRDTVTVATIDDALPESAETFNLTLSNISMAESSDSVAVATINDNDGGVTTISFASDIKPLLNTYCVTCHGGASTQSGFSVAAYNSMMTSGTRAPNVVASNGAGSRLYLCTTTSPLRDIDRMPQGGPYLTTLQQNLIKTWIDQGALNN